MNAVLLDHLERGCELRPAIEQVRSPACLHFLEVVDLGLLQRLPAEDRGQLMRGSAVLRRDRRAGLSGTFNPRSCAADHRLTTETP
jgi:hypothetical protein